MGKYSINKLPNDVAQELAQKLRALRKQKKWSQAELAERSGVSLGSIKRFEQKGEISLRSLLALIHLFGRLDELDEVLKIDENANKESWFSV